MVTQAYPACTVSDKKNNQLDDCGRSSAMSMLLQHGYIYLHSVKCHHHHQLLVWGTVSAQDTLRVRQSLMASWLCAGVQIQCQGSTAGWGRVRDCFLSVLQSQHLCRLLRLSLSHLHVHSMHYHCAQIPGPHFSYNSWSHENTQILHNIDSSKSKWWLCLLLLKEDEGQVVTVSLH